MQSLLPPDSNLQIYRFMARPRQPADPRSMAYLSDAQALGLSQIESLECRDLYFIEADPKQPLDQSQLRRLALELLCDPLTQEIEWCSWQETDLKPVELHRNVSDSAVSGRVEVALRPGVTDAVAEQIVRAAKELGMGNVWRAATGLSFLVRGKDLKEADLHLLARRLLANPVIQRYTLGEIEPAFPQPAEASGTVEVIALRSMTDAQLLQLSLERRAALDLAEMQAIRAYFQAEGRDCTDVEFETIAQTWSEHCVHKTFKALVQLATTGGDEAALNTGSSEGDVQTQRQPLVINNLLNTYIRSATQAIDAPWVISAFTDNAGIIDFDDEYEISFKVETHNHPSAIEPFGGANTGVGGVIRDVIGVSAKPIANTDVLCFGPLDLPLSDLPEGVLHPRRLESGVVAGVQDYGNKIGIPTVNGAIWYDPGFTANPLVFCGCLGIAPKNKHRRNPQAGDRVIVLGGRTGRDGLRGATFSSMTMDAQTGEVAGASVQIGNPITEKGLIEVILRARDLGLYHAITDCGAGGLSSAVGEMGSKAGVDVDLASVRLKYPGLVPWEIWLSEAQERMVLSVPPSSLPALQRLCDLFDVELSDIGFFTNSGRLIVRYNSQPVLDLANDFLHGGIPQRHLKAAPPTARLNPLIVRSLPQAEEALLRLLAHPNIASKESVIRIYDHEVMGGTWIKPLVGVRNDGPSDACVLKPAGSRGMAGVVLSNGLNPEYGKFDAYNMAVSVVDEAVRNAIAVGADPDRLAVLDNFCWGDPRRSEVMWTLLEAARGCHDAALAHRTPFISGKDSLNNEYLDSSGSRQSIPPTLLISAVGVIEDVSKAVTMDLKQPGDFLYLVGEFQPCFGGSHYSLLFGQPDGLPDRVPLHSCLAPVLYRALHRAIVQKQLVVACHDLSEGGFGVAAAEMCIGGRLGLQVSLPEEERVAALFGETNGCLLVEVAPNRCQAFEEQMADLPCRRLGEVLAEPVLIFQDRSGWRFELPVERLVRAWVHRKVAGEL